VLGEILALRSLTTRCSLPYSRFGQHRQNCQHRQLSNCKFLLETLLQFIRNKYWTIGWNQQNHDKSRHLVTRRSAIVERPRDASCWELGSWETVEDRWYLFSTVSLLFEQQVQNNRSFHVAID